MFESLFLFSEGTFRVCSFARCNSFSMNDHGSSTTPIMVGLVLYPRCTFLTFFPVPPLLPLVRTCNLNHVNSRLLATPAAPLPPSAPAARSIVFSSPVLATYCAPPLRCRLLYTAAHPCKLTVGVGSLSRAATPSTSIQMQQCLPISSPCHPCPPAGRFSMIPAAACTSAAHRGGTFSGNFPTTLFQRPRRPSSPCHPAFRLRNLRISLMPSRKCSVT
jgi:hypothetical protein